MTNDQDGRLEAGDQILKINGTELLGVSQLEAAQLIKETGSEVTLEVAKNAAAFHGLNGIFNNSSPVASRGRLQHSQSQSLAPLNPVQPPQFRQPPHLVPGMSLPVNPHQTAPSALHSLMQQSVTSAPQLQSHLHSPIPIQEERHYQNISMYRQPTNAPNGGHFVGPPQPHHTSYGSLHTPLNQPVVTQAPNGRPLSTVYTPNMMNRVTSMAQYPTHPGQPPLFRTPHSGSVPALHHWRSNPDNFPSHMMYPGSNGTGPQPVFMRPPHIGPTGRMIMKPAEQQEPIPAVSYRFGPSGYPSSKANDSFNNNLHHTGNAINNNLAMNGVLSTSSIISNNNHHNSSINNNNISSNHNNNSQWPRRTKHASAQEVSSQIDEQSERLRLLRFEELKRKQHELKEAELAEDRLLQEAKTRRQVSCILDLFLQPSASFSPTSTSSLTTHLSSVSHFRMMNPDYELFSLQSITLANVQEKKKKKKERVMFLHLFPSHRLRWKRK